MLTGVTVTFVIFIIHHNELIRLFPCGLHFLELFDDEALRHNTGYLSAMEEVEAILGAAPASGYGGQSLLDLLYAPMRAAPHSLEGQLEYIIDGLEGMTALLVDDQIAAIDLPQSVVMEIAETAPGIKGASASARTKPATMATGLMVQVPEYIEQGESIKINTADGKYMSRA